MDESEELFNVKAAAHLAGVSTHALRAWERRYQVVNPQRDSIRRRAYSFDDIQKLKLLSALTDNGHLIGNLARLSTPQLRKLLAQNTNENSSTFRMRTNLKSEIENLLNSLKTISPEQLDRLLIRMRLNLPLHELIFRVLSPLMQKISYFVTTDEIEVTQEHLLSTSIRNHLGELLGLIQRTFTWNEKDSIRLPRLIMTTPEGDQHEFGVLLAALIAANLGFKFIYLGPNMPAVDLANATRRFVANIIILGVSATSLHTIPSFVAKLTSELSITKGSSPVIWLGGPLNSEIRKLQRKNILEHFPSLESFNRRLTKLISHQKGT